MRSEHELSDEEKRFFINYFSKNTLIVENGDKARNIAVQQPVLWDQLFKMMAALVDFERRQVEDQAPASDFFMTLTEILKKIPSNVINDQGTIKIVSDAPVLEPNDGILHSYITKNFWFCLAVVLDRISDIAWRHLPLDEVRPSNFALMSDPRLIRAQISLFSDFEVKSVVGKMIDQAVIDGRKITEDNEIIIDKFIENAKADIEAAKRSYGERLIIEAGYELWQNKSKGHDIRFAIGLAIFSCCVGGAIWIIAQYGSLFLAGLPKKADGEHTYISILVVLACAVGFGWFLRFVAKYTSDNLALSTDASQRKVMVQTYLALVADKDAKMEPADRSMMLHRAFGPLPGQQADDIPAPTLIEIVQKAISSKP